LLNGSVVQENQAILEESALQILVSSGACPST
jgi:hypothetical protein